MAKMKVFFDAFCKSLENSDVNVKHDLTKLSAFIDSYNTIRSKSRLNRTEPKDDLLNPSWFPAKHLPMFTMISQMHEDDHYEHTEYVKSLVQRRFFCNWTRNWIAQHQRLGYQVKEVGSGTHPTQLGWSTRKLGEGIVCPFKRTGVKFFGTFEATVLRRPLKQRCCLFRLLVTRAAQIEVINELRIEVCMTAITSFLARRGGPHTVNSDNGTTFVQAVREFKECFNEWDRNAMCE